MKKLINSLPQDKPSQLSRKQQKAVTGGSSPYCQRCVNSGCPSGGCSRCRECA
jgi:hypothetical protein